MRKRTPGRENRSSSQRGRRPAGAGAVRSAAAGWVGEPIGGIIHPTQRRTSRPVDRWGRFATRRRWAVPRESPDCPGRTASRARAPPLPRSLQSVETDASSRGGRAVERRSLEAARGWQRRARRASQAASARWTAPLPVATQPRRRTGTGCAEAWIAAAASSAGRSTPPAVSVRATRQRRRPARLRDGERARRPPRSFKPDSEVSETSVTICF